MNTQDTLKALTDSFKIGVSDTEDGSETFVTPSVAMIPLLFATSALLSKMDVESENFINLSSVSASAGEVFKDITSDPEMLTMITELMLNNTDMRKAYYTFLEGVVEYKSAIDAKAQHFFKEELNRVLYKDIDKSNTH